MKYFIITVDTEGDNLWNYHAGDVITTKNTQYIPRFQELCNQYGFKPVYLTNYEMINDDNFVKYIKNYVMSNLCEVGIHIHAWNNPPLYDLGESITDNPYLIEYPFEVMEQKFSTTYELICKKIGIKPVTHRAGRWAMNSDYFRILKKFNILVDCSFTPYINWSNNMGAKCGGSDYSQVSINPSYINGVLEVPVSILPTNEKIEINLKLKLYYFLKRLNVPYKTIWLRPANSSLDDMIKLIDHYEKYEKVNYLEFMVHSSELMPNGSPYFRTKKSITKMYDDINHLFDYIKKHGYVGCTLKEYSSIFDAK